MPRIAVPTKSPVKKSRRPAKKTKVSAVRARTGTKPARRVTAKKRGPRTTTPSQRQSAGTRSGTYITPKGNVSIGIPPFWTLRQTNDDLEVESPSGATSVIVTAFQRDDTLGKLNAGDYLERFLRNAPAKGKVKVEANGRSRAVSRFRDLEGDHWEVSFLIDGDTLLLATLNSTLPGRSAELQTGADILRTLTLKDK